MLYTIVISLLLSVSLPISAITTAQLIANEGYPIIHTDLYGYNILDLSSCRLHEIESIDVLPVIFNGERRPFASVPNSKLIVSDNCLYELPSAIGNIIELKALFASDNNLTSIPESISLLSNLEYLYLGRNNIEYIPDAIGWLIKLKILDLNANRLVNLPVTIGYLINLTHVFLNDNKLTICPVFHDKVHVDIRNNCFSTINNSCSQQVHKTAEDFLIDDYSSVFIQPQQGLQIDYLIFPN